MVKNLPVNAGDLQEKRFLSLGREDPLEKEMAATAVFFFFFLPGKSHGQRSLAGYSSWDSKESDTLVYYNAIIYFLFFNFLFLFFLIIYIFLYTMVGCEKTGIDTVFVLNFFSS